MARGPYNPCWTCRRRHIQCDQSEAPCAKCRKAGLACFNKRPIRWVKGVAIRGKMQGRTCEELSKNSSAAVSEKQSRVRSKSPAAEAKTFWDNGTLLQACSSFTKFDSLEKKVRLLISRFNKAPSVENSPRLPIALQDPSISSLDEISRYYIYYYDERVCKLLIVSDSDKNPLRNLIPLGLSDSVLRKAIIALAARHLANAGQSFNQIDDIMSSKIIPFTHNALLYKHHAIDALSRVLRNQNESQKETTVASIFLLILLDILESGCDGWNFHLEGAKSLITSHPSQMGTVASISQGPSQTLQGLRDFLAQQIYLVETLGSLFICPNSAFQSVRFDEKRMTQESIEDSFLICPAFLSTAIRYISQERDIISRSKHSNDTDERTRIRPITSMLELVENFDSYGWALSLPQSRQPFQQETDSLCILSEVYKIGTVLYGRRVLDTIRGKATSQDDLVSELLGLLNALRSNPTWLKCVLWPIFVAGLECRLPAQRKFFIMHLEEFWMATKCLNAMNAAKILEDYWQQDDTNASSWIFDIGRFGRAWLLI